MLLGVFLLLSHPSEAHAAVRIAILDSQLRQGWTTESTRYLGVRLEGDLLIARPTDRTRAYATAALVAGPDAAPVDGRSCAYLTFEINTLGGSTGAHRAPSLRVGLSDATRRTRQPLLSRYIHLDADPTTWQQVLIPLSHLIDRGVRADALTCVSWQYAGSAAPFAIRRVALAGSPDPADLPADGPGNLLADSSFETRADARPIWALAGDYRDEAAPGERELRRGYAAHGRRFLRLRGSRAYFFEALAPRADAVGFSVALRIDRRPREDGARRVSLLAEPGAGASPGPEAARDAGAAAARAEIGCEVVGFGGGGGVAIVGRAVRPVTLEGSWRRHSLSAIVQPTEVPPDEGTLSLYRGWVRPLGDGLDLDAVQLAPMPLREDQYQERRANSLAAGEGIFRQVRGLIAYRGHSDERDAPVPPRFQADLPPLSVPVDAREWAGRAWSPATISGCVPLARGRVFSPDALRLRAPDGREVPFQFDVLRRDRRDGSVRSLWLTFQAPLAAGERASYALESGATTAPPLLPVASQEGDAVVLHTSDLLARASSKEFSLLTEARWGDSLAPAERGGIRLELLDGTRLTSHGPPSQVAVERNGPLHAVVVVRGYLAPADGDVQQRFRYEARLRAWRGIPGMQVDIAVTNLTPEPATPVRSLALVLPMGRARRAEAAIGIAGGAPVTATLGRDDCLRVTQRRDPFRSGREDVLIEAPDADPSRTFGRAGGWATWQVPERTPILLAFSHMADRHPAALEVTPGEMAAYLIPPTGVQVFDFPFGLSAYGEFWVGSGEPPALVLDRLQRPPLLVPDPEHASRAGVFGAFSTTAETRRRFPLLEWILDREMALGASDQERVGETGWLNDGDTGSFGCWMHGEAGAAEGLYTHYLRTGDPAIWARARRQALHLREVCAWWSNEESAFQHPGSGGTHFGYRPDFERLGITGLLYDYWITGDARSLQTAEGLGAQLLSRTGSGHYHGWERGRTLLHLAELYTATGRQVYRDGLLRLLARRLPPEAELAEAGVTVAALAEALEAMERPELMAQFQQQLGALQSVLQSACPVRSVPGARESYLFRALSRAPASEVNPAVWDAALQHMLWLFLTPHGRDLSLPRATQALPAIVAAGGALPAWARGTALGVGNLSGQDRELTVRVHRHGNDPEGVTVCRMRAPRADPSRRYRVALEVRDPLGRTIKRDLLEGDAFTVREVTLPRRGLEGDYLLHLMCEEDGLVEVVTDHPYTYLRADEWKIPRHANARLRFYLRGPSGGEVRVAARGTIARQGDGLVGAVLRTPDGRLLAHARWSVPLAGTGADGQVPTRALPDEPLRLPVPLELRGKPLLLEVTAPRSVEWRVEGLDEPWLASVPEAFPSHAP